MSTSILALVAPLLVLWLSVWLGMWLRKKTLPDKDTRDDLLVIQAATLTLLGLIIGFSFSMAISRYDQRKVFEEAEANAIRAEFLRAELLPTTYTTKVQDLLRKYLDQRIAFYEAQDWEKLQEANRNVTQLQAELWSAVRAGTATIQAPIAVSAISGLNAVMDSQGNTQAAWLDHIPLGAWALMVTVACFASLLIGVTAHRIGVLMVLPVVFAVAFFAISDLDHPHGGLIHPRPYNLISLSDLLKQS